MANKILPVADALKQLYEALGGDDPEVLELSTNTELIQEIAKVASSGGSGLPEVSDVDEGKVLTVDSSGEWAAEMPSGGSPWDAVIRLTHAANSGGDTEVNLQAEVVSGTFEDIWTKVKNGGCPIILIEYKSLFNANLAFSFIGGFVSLYDENENEKFIAFNVIGPSLVDNSPAKNFGTLAWFDNGTIGWD